MNMQTQRQRQRRQRLKNIGYKRLDVYISPKLFKQLRPHLGRYGDSHTGASLVKFLEGLMKEWKEPE